MTVHDLLPQLPEPAVLRRRCVRWAVLDAVFGDDYRAHAFERRDDGVAVASFDNGSGDSYTIVFDPDGGVVGFGFDHESPSTPWRTDPRAHWPGLLDGLPEPLSRHAADPRFQLDGFLDATVCWWRAAGDDSWHCGPVVFDEDKGDDDGADWLFEGLTDWDHAAITEQVRDYWGAKDADADAIAAVCDGAPLTAALITAINPAADPKKVLAEAHALTYPG